VNGLQLSLQKLLKESFAKFSTVHVLQKLCRVSRVLLLQFRVSSSSSSSTSRAAFGTFCFQEKPIAKDKKLGFSHLAAAGSWGSLQLANKENPQLSSTDSPSPTSKRRKICVK
jgi:hypothetical protein